MHRESDSWKVHEQVPTIGRVLLQAGEASNQENAKQCYLD